MKFERSSGVLLHPTSLPGPFGIGDLGEHAYRFIDILVESRQKLWQIFPLGPTGYGDSPYQSFSAFAGNPLLISLEALVEIGLLNEADLKHDPFDDHAVNYWPVIQYKTAMLMKAHRHFLASARSEYTSLFEAFCEAQSRWLEDYALFMALKDAHGGAVWNSWDEELVTRQPAALASCRTKLVQEISYQKFIQFLFFTQWHALKEYAGSKGIRIIGDIPIFVAFDSMDAWANPEFYYFDEKGRPEYVAGVPPDYFSATGQLWGNPLYRWELMKERGYTWWIERFKKSFELVDIVRVDHFRGFVKYWRVPAGERTAIKGSWEPGPGEELFRTIEEALGRLPIIAEDLGVITPDVVALREAFDFPGMKILQFAFDSGEKNDYLPHTYDKNCVVYTGTHDNDTTRGWFEKASEQDKHMVRTYLQSTGTDICWDFIHAAWSSVADMAMVPLQDILELGSEARMNTPSTLGGNWAWRFTWDMISQDALERLKLFTKIYDR
ncbi:4-alpha-glucanotransferase [candidate division KSB3 bacterium]|uniref:4-alpha-glucanotransferase n=1 Tax=candidate division KSB3 bacterium TaxID=2044937 RepID=A0A2G6E386_9BACT|nr:MAG: 4-alpha-glucanotransferase [candidate division KSB3 bacterium]PIE29083.1 MAG: 4-alpha-glucanotransferase [candidate division KSB3 bacterium]